jgi:hypothetical protein
MSECMILETPETTVSHDDDKNDDIANYTSDAMTKSNLLFGPRSITPSSRLAKLPNPFKAHTL